MEEALEEPAVCSAEDAVDGFAEDAADEAAVETVVVREEEIPLEAALVESGSRFYELHWEEIVLTIFAEDQKL